MKTYKNILIIYFLLIFAVFLTFNLVNINAKKECPDRPYIVEISRLERTISETGEIPDLSGFEYVKQIIECRDNGQITNEYQGESCFKEINNKLYRFNYVKSIDKNNQVLLINIILAVFFAITFGVLIFIYLKIIRPFNKLEDIPTELAKGNLNIDIKENRAKYFGKYIWGTNMLRDEIKKRRDNELELQREKKLLILSLTHDLKTPLSVIKLNTQALEKDLYKDEERRKKAIKDIHTKTNEIDNYLTEIIAATKEDFLDLSVVEENFYLDDIINNIENTYKSRLDFLKTSFTIQGCKNVLLAGDEARLVEVLQNILENAIKYGDGQSITINCQREQGYVLIAVSNTGDAMADGEVNKIFESFYRGSNASDKEGSGLGLYICRQLMNNMKGDVFAKQENGSFTVTVVVRIV